MVCRTAGFHTVFCRTVASHTVVNCGFRTVVCRIVDCLNVFGLPVGSGSVIGRLAVGLTVGCCTAVCRDVACRTMKYFNYRGWALEKIQ